MLHFFVSALILLRDEVTRVNPVVELPQCGGISQRHSRHRTEYTWRSVEGVLILQIDFGAGDRCVKRRLKHKALRTHK
jgi:hypothetical protein